MRRTDKHTLVITYCRVDKARSVRYSHYIEDTYQKPGLQAGKIAVILKR